jgi:Family of unknown function (DUF6418)
MSLSFYLGIFFVSIFLIFVIYIFKYYQLIFWIMFLFIFGQLSSMLSNIFLETGVYVTELQRYTYETGSTLRLVFYNMVFFISLFMVLKVTTVKLNTYTITKSFSPFFSRLTNLVSVLFIFILMVNLILFGVPLLEKLDRFIYWNNHPYPIFKTILGQSFVISFLLGINCVFSRKKSSRLFSIILFILIIVCQIFDSIKFSGIFMSLYWFMFPILIRMCVLNKKLSLIKSVITGVLAIVGFLIILNFNYQNVYQIENPFEYIVYRAFGLQGHVWWATDALVFLYGERDPGWQMYKELEKIFLWNGDDDDLGMRFLMQLIAPQQLAWRYIDKGVDFTLGYPAIGLYIFGPIGLIFLQVIMAFLVALVAYYLVTKVTRGQLIRSVLAAKIFIEVYGALTIGNLWMITNWKVFLYILIVLVLELLSSSYIKIYMRNRNKCTRDFYSI